MRTRSFRLVNEQAGLRRTLSEQRERHWRPLWVVGRTPDRLRPFHGLRHVATTLMIANNEHPMVIQHRLGHADPAMSLGVYGHVPDDLDQAAAVRLDGLFRQTPTNEGSG